MRTKHAARRASVVLAVGVATLFGAATAQAAFDPSFAKKCTGGSIAGAGASFQVNAHSDATNGWIPNFKSTYCPLTTPFGASGGNITYTSTGSGAGMDKFGRTGGNTPGYVRDATVRFVGSDDAPTVAQKAKMEAGDSTIATDNGVLHTIPIAQGAVTVDVNFPTGCTIPSTNYWMPADGSTSRPQDGTTRFKTTNARIEKAFEGDASVDTWGELLPGIAAVPGGPKTDAQCQNFPITRVVRQDSSGTTFAFKQFLQYVNDSAFGGSQVVNWSEQGSNYGLPALGNTSWPNDTGGTAVQRSASSGGGALLTKLASVEGGIGYAGLADARSKGFDMTPVTADPSVPVNLPNDKTFWIPVTNGANLTTDPQKFKMAYKTGQTSATKGSKCAGVTYSNVPAGADPTLASWSAVTGAGSTVSYGACALTYGLAWDDYADVYGTSASEQSQARTVADYFKYITGAGGSLLYKSDYAPLSTSIKTVSQAGASAIGWNK